MSTKYARGVFVSDALLNRAAALEGFDTLRTGARGSEFKTRLTRCADLAGEPFTQLVADVDRWVLVIRAFRNDVAHQLGQRSTQLPAEQYFLSESVYWLFVMCMLREAGAPSALFEEMSKHQLFQWLGPKVRSTVAQYALPPSN
jgi:hypothetical protein